MEDAYVLFIAILRGYDVITDDVTVMTSSLDDYIYPFADTNYFPEKGKK